ncbi:MAG: hypothetical protein V6Z86_00840 [Hyphomicrobiales bacterium]
MVKGLQAAVLDFTRDNVASKVTGMEVIDSTGTVTLSAQAVKEHDG